MSHPRPLPTSPLLPPPYDSPIEGTPQRSLTQDIRPATSVSRTLTTISSAPSAPSPDVPANSTQFSSVAIVPTEPRRAPEPYPKPDPFVEALNHAKALTTLCNEHQVNDKLRILHLGELIVGLTQLLTKSRQLDALDPEEEHDQIVKMIRCVMGDELNNPTHAVPSDIERINAIPDHNKAVIQRTAFWKYVQALLEDIKVL